MSMLICSNTADDRDRAPGLATESRDSTIYSLQTRYPTLMNLPCILISLEG